MDNTELQNVNYKLIDAASREIQKGKLDAYNGRFLIHTKSIATGNYILVIEGVGTYKFIKN